MDRLNQEELEALMAPIPELVDQLGALEPVMDAWFDGLPEDFSGEFHCGRPDAVMKAPASTMAAMILNRIGPFTAVGRGLPIVGGRRPWKAMKLQSWMEKA